MIPSHRKYNKWDGRLWELLEVFILEGQTLGMAGLSYQSACWFTRRLIFSTCWKRKVMYVLVNILQASDDVMRKCWKSDHLKNNSIRKALRRAATSRSIHLIAGNMFLSLLSSFDICVAAIVAINLTLVNWNTRTEFVTPMHAHMQMELLNCSLATGNFWAASPLMQLST